MKIYLLVFLIFFIQALFAQPYDDPDKLRSKTFELSVKTVPSEELKLPFQFIKIIDGRYDTSKLGFRITRKFVVSVKNVFEKILLKPGIEKGIENFYNEYYKNNFTANGNLLLVSIKKLWLNYLPERERQYKKIDINPLSKQNIYAEFEYYFGKEDAYVPLIRIDTIFQLTPDIKVDGYNASDEDKLPFFCFSLERMIENVNYDYYTKAQVKKKKMTVEEIINYNKAAKNIPILTEPIKQGLFLTFNEFKINKPSVLSFTKRKIQKKKILEIRDENGKLILDYFAFYDGNKLAINKPLSGLFASNISQYNYAIYKVGSTFQFFENHIMNDRFEVGVSDTRGVNNGIQSNIVWVPREIDMETGEFY